MGAHVCACPNHIVGRTTPLQTRANVAFAGIYGYELDITKLSQEDKNEISALNAQYHKYQHLILDGLYFRIASYLENGVYDCWQITARDRRETLVTPCRLSLKIR